MDATVFLKNRDHTGRFIVVSTKTGCRYFVEPMDDPRAPRTPHGDIDPATGKLQGSYGEKFKGSIHPSDSLITKENGFKDIKVLPAGVSPHAEIERIDALRYTEGWRPGSEHHNSGVLGSNPV